MNLDQYNSYKERVLTDLYNKKIPHVENYLTKNFSPDDFLDLIKEMESDGLINNIHYIHGAEGHNHVIPSFQHVVITSKGMDVIE